jgi:hypothetical protein
LQAISFVFLQLLRRVRLCVTRCSRKVYLVLETDCVNAAPDINRDPDPHEASLVYVLTHHPWPGKVESYVLTGVEDATAPEMCA